ncbi:hypothetical protein A1O1_01196 [Capronia coronata CBS 617.96]|uniref:Uncharacterized protein n=1 Tax=Capronia coronata CBS 617.96 TaxID=1182541 RepID=W9Z290_9EURO|nr:uncharacterized protein A1O1_01196 [Capronia coronata CBS 617.96]EXJ96070.1 hypothetical protein A1O1_01196 [Capronia coronata CBS 617.96]
MAQRKSDSQDVDAQSDLLQDSSNPQLLNSEMTMAFQELARGERTASALESKLDSIERRIEELLASIEESPSPTQQQKAPSSDMAKPK